MLFKNKRPNREKLLHHGFRADGGNLIRREEILNQMTLTITVDERGTVTTEVRDADGEPYTLHLVDSACGKFVGAVKNSCEEILNNLAAQCFDDENFSSAQALELVAHVREKFSDEPEFLWAKFPNYAVFRRKDNRKWYAVILAVAKNKLGLAGEEELEILNLRVDPAELDRIVDGERYFRGWHMNKKSWLTLPLDGTLTFEEISARLEESYRLAAKK